MNRYKAIFFDADNTLVDFRECEKQALRYVFDSAGIAYKPEYQAVFSPLDRALWENGAYDGVAVPQADIPVYRFKALFAKIGVAYDDFAEANHLFKAGLASTSALVDKADEAVACLHRRGYLLSVVTNGLIELQKPRIANSKIGQFISHIIVSEEVGASKPNPLIFNTLLARMNMNPRDVIMVGDSLQNDMQGARNAGIQAVWYNPERSPNNTNISPDYEIHDLAQLVDMLA